MRDAKPLIEIAAKHAMNSSDLKDPKLELAFPESYIPYIPVDWNGVLVLAESQNLSNPQDQKGYFAALARFYPRERISRLPWKDEEVGIEPWDNGMMKLMIKCFNSGWEVGKIAVSNAVPWSCRTIPDDNKKPQNVNPTPVMIKQAIAFWIDMLRAMDPDLKVVVTFGAIARDVLNAAKDKAGWSGAPHHLRLPSDQAMNRMASMFNRVDLLERFSVVREACESLSIEAKNLTPGKVVFACHAASLGIQS